MAKEYLDKAGLAYFWSKIKAYGNTHWGGGGGSVLDFYPVGSYYETSDDQFDPNISWGGTWIRETSGQVHVSADDPLTIGTGTYHVSGALNANGAGTKDGGEPTVTLDTTEIPAHTHGSKTLTASFSGRRQGNDYASHWAGTNTTVAKGSGTATSDAAGTTNKHQDVISFSMTHTHDSVGEGQAHNNMQPYIVVNRWHRTA